MVIEKTEVPYDTDPFRDYSLWLLIVSNLITIYLSIAQSWDFSTVLWVYWMQSVIIGIFNVIKILDLRNFSTEGLSINGHSVSPDKHARSITASFFALHYGLFHFIYAVFIFIEGSIDWSIVLSAAGIFFVNHLFSFFYNRARDQKNQNIGKVMMRPYARIIPMHLTLIFGSLFAGLALPFFLVLKTIADCVTHISEHRMKPANPVVDLQKETI